MKRQLIRNRLIRILDAITKFRSLLKVIKHLDDSEFRKFVNTVKHDIKEIAEQCQDKPIKQQLYDTAEYVIFDDLNFIKQAITMLFARTTYGFGWTKRNFFLYDIEELELKISGVIYKLDRLEADANNR